MDALQAAIQGRWSFVMGMVLSGLLAGCVGRSGVGAIDEADWIHWKTQRLESAAGTNGWASLVGLHWLPEGASTSGTRSGLDHVFPSVRAPELVGVWHRSGTGCAWNPRPV